MTTPDGNSFWASPTKTFNASYDSNSSTPNTPKAVDNLHSHSFISELQDVTKALEKFTFNSPLNDVKAHGSDSESVSDRKSHKCGVVDEVHGGGKLDSWPLPEGGHPSSSASKSLNNLVDDEVENHVESASSPQPDVLPRSASSLRRGVSPINPVYDLPKSLSSPRSPVSHSAAVSGDGASTTNAFFSGRSLNSTEIPQVSAVPEPAHAVLVSSSVRTYEPKTNFCHPVLHPPQHAVHPTSTYSNSSTTIKHAVLPASNSSSGINMYSESPDSLSSASAHAVVSTKVRDEEDESTSSSLTAASSFTLHDSTLSPLINLTPSTFHTFGADDDDVSSHDAEEAAQSSAPSFHLNRVAPGVHSSTSGKLSAIHTQHVGKTSGHFPLLNGLGDSGYTSSTSSFDVMSKSSTSAASSMDDGGSQMSSPNDLSVATSSTYSETTTKDVNKARDNEMTAIRASATHDTTILIRPTKHDVNNVERAKSPVVIPRGGSGDYSSFGSLERKRVAKVVVNADGSISPGNTLERKSSGKRKESPSTDERGQIVLPSGQMVGVSGDGGNQVFVTPTGSLERKKKSVGARVNLMTLEGGRNGGTLDSSMYASLSKRTPNDIPYSATTTVVSDSTPIIRAGIQPQNYMSKEKSLESACFSSEPALLSSSLQSSKYPSKALLPSISLPSHQDARFVDEEASDSEASKPSSEIVVASAQLLPDHPIVSVNPPAQPTKPLSSSMEPVAVQRVIMPDVVPLQEQEQRETSRLVRGAEFLESSCFVLGAESDDHSLAQHDVGEVDSPEARATPPLPMNDIDVSCYQQPLSPRLDQRIQQKFDELLDKQIQHQKFDELLEKQIQQQMDQQKFDELLEKQIQQQMVKKQKQQQQTQNSECTQQNLNQESLQQNQNPYATPKIHYPQPSTVQLRSQPSKPLQHQPQSTQYSLPPAPRQPQQSNLQQQPQQQQQSYPPKPPSKPPRKFNLDTLSRVIEEDEEELEALFREEIAKKNREEIAKKNRESGFAELPSLDEEDDDYDEVGEEEEEENGTKGNYDTSVSEAMMTAKTSSTGASAASSIADVMIESEILMTSTPDNVAASSLDAIFTSALDNTDDDVARVEDENADRSCRTSSEEVDEEVDSGVSREDEEEVSTEDADEPVMQRQPQPQQQQPPTQSRNRPTSLTLKIEPQPDSDDILNGNVFESDAAFAAKESSPASASGSSTPSSATAPTKSMNDLFAKIHESKKRMNVRSDYDLAAAAAADISDSRSSISSASNSRSSSPVLSIAGSVESGVLSPRCLTPTAGGGTSGGKGLAADRRGKKAGTSLHDFKMMLVHKTPANVGTTKKFSAVDMLKANKATPPTTPTTSPLSSPFPFNASGAAKKFPFTNVNSLTGSPLIEPEAASSFASLPSTPLSSSVLSGQSRSNPGSPRKPSIVTKTYDPAVLGALRNRRLVNEMAPDGSSGVGAQSARSRLTRPEAGQGRHNSPARHILETLNELDTLSEGSSD